MTPIEYRSATKLVRGSVKRLPNQKTSEALYMTFGFVYSSAEEAATSFRGEADGLSIRVMAIRQLKRLKIVWPCLKLPKPAGQQEVVWRRYLARWPAG